jgi:hypothetical protein
MDRTIAAAYKDSVAATLDGLAGEPGTTARAVDGVMFGLDARIAEGGKRVAHNGFAAGRRLSGCWVVDQRDSAHEFLFSMVNSDRLQWDFAVQGSVLQYFSTVLNRTGSRLAADLQ